MDYYRHSTSLGGTWQTIHDHENAQAYLSNPEIEALPWESCELPARKKPEQEDKLRDRKLKCLWVRRDFIVEKKNANRGAVLKWNGIRFGATVWINGREVARHKPLGPHTVMFPADTLHAGTNSIVLKVNGWAGIETSKSGYKMMPVGSGNSGWGNRNATVYDDIWIEYYDQVYLTPPLAMPDLKQKSVTFRVGFDGVQDRPAKVKVRAIVRPVGSDTIVGENTVILDSARQGMVPVSLKSFTPWTPESPVLYKATISVQHDGKKLDEVSFTFGMREFKVVSGHYRLNGNPIWLRGSNLVDDPRWVDVHGNIKGYLIDEARNMNLNCFRTHTLPLPTEWLDICDENGMMILSENPMMYNTRNYKFDAEEQEEYNRNAMLDSSAWVTKLWNHPSIVTWVLSNESTVESNQLWEAGALHDRVRELDPTRPTMRAHSEIGTPESVDVHFCTNYAFNYEGAMIERMTSLAAKKDPTRTLSCSEYMNLSRFGSQMTSMRMLGIPPGKESQLNFAIIALEHTEVMRRKQFDCILPYMYSGWEGVRFPQKWRDAFPTPISAALYSAMAPVLASLDLFDRNFETGQTLDIDLSLINDLDRDIEANLAMFITEINPLLMTEPRAVKKAVWETGEKVSLSANSIEIKPVQIQLPEDEGVYYLGAVIKRDGVRDVISQREVRVLNPAQDRKLGNTRQVFGVGLSTQAEAWIKERGVMISSGAMAELDPTQDVVLVWNFDIDPTSSLANDISSFAQRGGRIIVLYQDEWGWLESFGLGFFGKNVGKWPERVFASRAFAYPGREDHAFMSGIHPNYLRRWNGVPNRITDRVLKIESTVPLTHLLWSQDKEKPVLSVMPLGKGEVIISTLFIQTRIDGPTQDPVCSRLLANLLRR